MALVQSGSVKINGRNYPVSYDTDDLDQLSYHYYRRAQKLGMWNVESALLHRRITGEYIESHPEKYGDLID